MARRYVPRTKPFKHQAKATLRAVREKSLGFFMEPGTGKTKAALDAVAIQALRGEVERVLVVCPLNALGVWEQEIVTHFPFQAYVETHEYEVQIVNKDLPLTKGVCFYLINYDKWSVRDRHGKRWLYPYQEELVAFDPDLIICDESHRLGSAGAIRTQQVWRFTQRARTRRGTPDKPYVYLLSGTPNPNGYINLFSQYRILDSSLFGTNKGGFEEKYCRYGVGPNKYRIVKYVRRKELLRKIRSRAFIITKAECLDLPPVMEPTIIRVPLPAQVRQHYREMAEEFVTWIDEETAITAANAGVKFLRLQQITGGFTTDGEEIHGEKIRYAKDLLVDLYDSREQVVCYARFLPEVKALARAAEGVGYETVAISGSTSRRDRDRAVKRFQDSTRSKSPMALVFQVQTGSEAITLTRAAHILFYSLPLSWGTYWQAISRLDRIGQRRSISHYYLICPGTLDVRQLATLREKRNMHAELMGNPEGFLLGD